MLAWRRAWARRVRVLGQPEAIALGSQRIGKLGRARGGTTVVACIATP